MKFMGIKELHELGYSFKEMKAYGEQLIEFVKQQEKATKTEKKTEKAEPPKETKKGAK